MTDAIAAIVAEMQMVINNHRGRAIDLAVVDSWVWRLRRVLKADVPATATCTGQASAVKIIRRLESLLNTEHGYAPVAHADSLSLILGRLAGICGTLAAECEAGRWTIKE